MHHTSIAQRRVENLLLASALRVAATDPAAAAGSAHLIELPTRPVARTRRSEILAAGIPLFERDGFATVTNGRIAEHDGRERLVDLGHVQVVDGQAAFARALRVAGAGPVSMMVGSAPETVAAAIRARGVSPAAVPATSVPISTSDAPSTIPDELPARRRSPGQSPRSWR